MANAATNAHCPECSAPVKTGDKQCWMCFRLLDWNGGSVKITATSPFADGPVQLPRTYYRTNPWAIVGLILAAITMVPAACIAFFVTCLVTISANPRAGDEVLPVSAGAAFIVFVGFCVLIGILGTRITREVRQ